MRATTRSWTPSTMGGRYDAGTGGGGLVRQPRQRNGRCVVSELDKIVDLGEAPVHVWNFLISNQKALDWSTSGLRDLLADHFGIDRVAARVERDRIVTKAVSRWVDMPEGTRKAYVSFDNYCAELIMSTTRYRMSIPFLGVVNFQDRLAKLRAEVAP